MSHHFHCILLVRNMSQVLCALKEEVFYRDINTKIGELLSFTFGSVDHTGNNMAH